MALSSLPELEAAAGCPDGAAQFRAAHGVPGRLLVAHQDEQDRGARAARPGVVGRQHRLGQRQVAAPGLPEPAALGMRSQVESAHQSGSCVICRPRVSFRPAQSHRTPAMATPAYWTEAVRVGPDTPAARLVRRVVPRCWRQRVAAVVDHLGPTAVAAPVIGGPSAALWPDLPDSWISGNSGHGGRDCPAGAGGGGGAGGGAAGRGGAARAGGGGGAARAANGTQMA